jgi:mono/diheme cytochrome c family protein
MTPAALLAMLLVVGCGRGALRSVEWPPITDADRAARAREDYLRSCARCHGADGRGVDAAGASEGARALDLTRLAERLGPQFSREYVIEVITGEREVSAHGSREMPVWQYRFGDTGTEAAGALWAQQKLEGLAAYVESLQRHPASP